MAEIKQGLNYEITANDKSSAVVNKAAETAKKAAKDTEESSKKAGEAFKGEFNPMSAVLAGISGNTQALAQQMLGLVSRMKSVHMTMMRFSVYAAIITMAVNAAKQLTERFVEGRIKANEIKLDKVEGALSQINEDQSRLNEQFDRAIEKSDAIANNLRAEIDATEKLTNARLEYNKALEISLAKTDEEKAGIERRYSAAAEQSKGETEKKRIATERDQLYRNIDILRDKYDEHMQSYWSQSDAAKQARKTALSITARRRNQIGYYLGMDEDASMGERAVQLQAEALREMQLSQQAMEDIEAKIAAAEKSLERLDKQEESVNLSMKTADLKAQEAEKEAKKAADAKLKAEKEAAEKLQAEKARDAQKAADDEAKAIKDAQLKANREVMDQRRKDLAALTEQESQAAARLAAAQSKVAEAWGWYRDKDKMAAVMAEEKADAKAREQYEKDFEKLRSRRDWRTAKDLSVDQEAVRRVALAKEEETAAQKALAETAKSTAQAAASLAEIEKVITQEG